MEEAKVAAVQALIVGKRARAATMREADGYSGYMGVNTQALRLEAEADGMERVLQIIMGETV